MTNAGSLNSPLRLATLERLGLRAAGADGAFDRLARLAATVLETPAALVSLVDQDRHVLQGAYGLPEPWNSCRAISLSRQSFCQHVTLTREPLAVEDALEHPLGLDNLPVAEIGVRAYLGIPLVTSSGESLGAFCVVDVQPRRWTQRELQILQDLAGSVLREFELRAAVRDAECERREKTALLESTSEGICGIDVEGYCTFINRAAAEMLGYAPSELIGKQLHRLAHHSHGDGTPYAEEDCPIMQACRTGKPVQLSNETIWRADGSSFPAEYSASPVVEHGRITGVVVTLRDVSERIRAEQSLRSREEHLRAIIETTPECVKLVAPDGRLMEMNSAGLRMLECERSDEAIGACVFDVIAPEDRDRFKEFHERVCAGEKRTLEFEIVGLCGTRRHMESHAVPLCKPDGSIAHLAITRDVTGRKRTERLLAGQKRILEMIAQGRPLTEVLDVLIRTIEQESRGMYGAVMLLERENRLRTAAAPSLPEGYVRATETVAIGPESGSCGTAAYRRKSVIVADLSRDPLWAKYRDVAKEHGLSACWSTPIVAADELLGTFALYYSEPRSPNVQEQELIEIATHLAGIAIERARAEETLRRRAEELVEADRRKDEFLAMLAHELRNPLAPIRSGLDLIAMENVNTETVELMRQQVDHLVRLVDDLLDVSRILRGKVVLRKESVELGAVAARAIEMARPLIDAQEHDLIRHFPREPVWIEADPVRMAQVIANLLNNAAKYTPRGGKIWLTAEREGDGVVLRVRDNGLGIEPELLPRVFDLFTQADRSIDRSQGGLGIGLTLVRSLVEMHDGTIFAHSAGLGQGSEFVVRLPTNEQPQRNPAGRAIFAGVPKRRVLVVDDNRGAAKMLAMLFSRLGGHEVRTADDGMMGLSVARQWQPELIILDIGLPGMNGYEVARQLRREAPFANTLLVAITGYGQEEDRHLALEAGFDEHLVKPPAMEALQRLFLHPKLNDSRSN